MLNSHVWFFLHNFLFSVCVFKDPVRSFSVPFSTPQGPPSHLRSPVSYTKILKGHGMGEVWPGWGGGGGWWVGEVMLFLVGEQLFLEKRTTLF